MGASVWISVGDKVLASRFLQQTAVLTYKNLLVAWRSRRATILRLLAPGIFLLLALVIQLSLDANSRRAAGIRALDVSGPEPIADIPDCHQDVYIGSRPCVTFVYSPNTSSVAQGIITGIKATNTPPIKDEKVIGFASRSDAEEYMLEHPESTLGAVYFDFSSSSGINYLIQTNTTTKGFRGNYQSPVTFFTMPLMSAVARETAKVQLAAAGKPTDVGWEPSLTKFPHPQLRSIGMVGYVLGPFIFAACMFGMVTQLGIIVGEKESGLVTSMRHMGLLQSSYWAAWVVFDTLMALATALSIVVWGNIMQFRFFLRNDSGLLVAVFWLFILALSSFAYFLSVFMSRAQSAVNMGFVVFLVGWICQTIVLFGLPYTPSYYFNPNHVAKGFFWVFACLPWCPLVKSTSDFGSATNSEKDPGIRWSQRKSYCRYVPDVADQTPYDPTQVYVDYDCIYPINSCLWTLLIQAVAWLALAVYLDNVLPTGHGKTRPLWYFLLPSYWANSRATTARQLRKTDSLTANSAAASWPGISSLRVAAQLPQELQQQQQQPPVEVQVGVSGAPGALPAVAGPTPSAAMPTSLPAVGAAAQEDEDVAAEAARMRALLHCKVAAGARLGSKGVNAARVQALEQAATVEAGHGPAAAADLSLRYAVEVYGLSKVFRGGGCCKLPCCGGGNDRSIGSGAGGDAGAQRKGRSHGSGSESTDFWAIKDSWFGIEEGQLFCLLGPNGAGKTTTINCLTGILAPSAGDMLVCGESVCTEGSLDRIRSQVGVCPQFDMLWGELTGMEHLVVAGHVKGLPFSTVRQHASELLGRVQLQGAAGVRSSSYSGGMKRRLSVALALLGDPHVLYLDEPTTGMDPISRRYVWDVIQAAKPGRAIVLTTHSMEEADILGDRIAIMARGKLKAIGSSVRLKQKFGAGYQVVATLQDPSIKTRAQQPPSGSPAEQQGTQAFDLFTPRSSPLGPQQPAAQDLMLQAEQQRRQAAAAVILEAKRAVRELFAQHLSGLAPAEEGKRSLRFLVPRQQQQQLVGLLQVIEQAVGTCRSVQSSSSNSSSTVCQGGLAGIADVQLSLTSLEEVFLNIAKQAELEEAAVTGARVTVQLPDTGREVLIGVGQDCVELAEHGPDTAGTQSHGNKRYRVKWVQDDSGALTVLEVLPVLAGFDGGSSAHSIDGARLARVAD